jgi:5S rRNA maturation endonuclease (ribonuclease M5)
LDDLNSLKHNPAVLKVYQQYTALKKESGRWMALCPLHQEKTSSFCVHQKDMLWTCYSGCGTGNVMQLVERKEGCTFKEAVAKVKEIVGDSNYSKQAAAVDATFRPAVEVNKTYKTYTLAEYAPFEKALVASKEAQDWLSGRGITLETAQKMHVGFRRDVGKRAGEKNEDISASGWLIFPCVVSGVVKSIKYRSIVRKAFTKEPGMSTELFGADDIDIFEPVLVCEGELDALALTQAGYHAVSLASASTSLTPQQKDKLMTASKVILAGDNDEPGQAAMQKLWRELGERTYMLAWGEAKDANQFLLEGCKGDKGVFVQKMDELIGQALKQPMKDVYDLQSVMLAGGSGPQIDRADRLRFPWSEIDQMMILVPGDVLSIFATQTGTGKTAFQMNVSVFNAIKYGRRVLNWQCELDPTLYATITTAHLLKKHRNHLTREDFKEAAEEMGEANYYIGYDPMLGPDEALDLMEAAIKRLSIDILVIDNVAYMVRSAVNEISIQAAVNKRIKDISKKHKVITLALGAPKKADNNRRGKVVQLQDLKGSGTASDDVDGLIALHRDTVKEDDSGSPARDNLEAKTKVVLLKARNKGEGNAQAELSFLGEFATFVALDFKHTGEE